MRAQQRKQRPDRRRYVVALHAAGGNLRAIASGEGVSERYLHHILAGQCSLSDRMEAALRAAVGPAGWRYALGESDVLPCVPDQVAA